MALPAYSAIYTDIAGGQFTPQVTVALWMAVSPLLSTATGPALVSAQNLQSQILSDPQLPIRVAFRILSTVLAGGQPTDASIQTAVSALIPASGQFTL
jgi:hypothetical protein